MYIMPEYKVTKVEFSEKLLTKKQFERAKTKPIKYIEILDASGDKEIFTPLEDGMWHVEYYIGDRKAHDYDLSKGLFNLNVLDAISSEFQDAIVYYDTKSFKGHRTRTPSKKCPVKVNFRKML